MARIVVLSDIHLSPTHGFFWENWCVAREFADAAKADAVIVNGDLAINGPDSDAEIAFAATALGSLRTRAMALPGNHDVGDEPPGQDPDQIINADRLARWDSSFATDRWVLDAGGWRLVGVNAQLFGSGLVREQSQDQWLDEQLSTAGRPTALFLHKPVFLEGPTDDVLSSLMHGAVGAGTTARQARSVRRASDRQRSPASTSRPRIRWPAASMGTCRRLCRRAGAWRRWPLRRHGTRLLTKQCRGYHRTATWAGLARPGRNQGARPLSVPARYAAFSSASRRLTQARTRSRAR